MIRKLILAVVILAMAVVPVPALARDGGHGFHGAGQARVGCAESSTTPTTWISGISPSGSARG